MKILVLCEFIFVILQVTFLILNSEPLCHHIITNSFAGGRYSFAYEFEL